MFIVKCSLLSVYYLNRIPKNNLREVFIMVIDNINFAIPNDIRKGL